MPQQDAVQPLERPSRADARRNYDLLVQAAREAFAEHGTKTSLEEIARRAGVGIGTLYRRFPSRQSLLEAVYLDAIRSICDRANEFAGQLPPWEALVAWLRAFVDFCQSREVAYELIDALGRDSELFHRCRTEVRSAAAVVLARAQEAGAVRDDVDVMDVMRLVSGINHTDDGDRDQSHRMLTIVLDGLRAERDRDHQHPGR